MKRRYGIELSSPISPATTVISSNARRAPWTSPCQKRTVATAKQGCRTTRRSPHSGWRASASAAVADALGRPSAASQSAAVPSASAAWCGAPCSCNASAACFASSAASSSRSRSPKSVALNPWRADAFTAEPGSASSAARSYNARGPAEVVVVRPHARELDEDGRAPRAGGQPLQLGLEQRPRPQRVAGLVVRGRRIERPPAGERGVVGRGELPCSLEEQRGGSRRASRESLLRGGVERRRDRAIGLVDGRGEVPPARLGVVGELGEPRVDLGPPLRLRELVRPGRQERVREADAVAVRAPRRPPRRRARARPSRWTPVAASTS